MADVTLERLYRAFTLMDFDRGSHFVGRLTYVVDPSQFYVIPSSFLHNIHPLNSIQLREFRAESLAVGKIFVYESQFQDVHKHYDYKRLNLSTRIRGKVVSIDKEQNCRMFALDHGFHEDNVGVERIFYPAHDDAEATPPLALPCTLDKCYPTTDGVFTPEATILFNHYLEYMKLRMVVKNVTENKIHVSVRGRGEKDLATILASAGQSTPTDPNPPLYTPLTFKHKQMLVGKTFTVRVQSGKSLKGFYVSPEPAYKVYQQFHSEFNVYCQSMREITMEQFIPGQVVGVRKGPGYDYERGYIMSVSASQTKAKVRLVDWGNVVFVAQPNVKAIQNCHFTRVPACVLYITPEPDFTCWTFTNRLLQKGFRFTIMIKIVGDAFDEPHVVAMKPIKNTNSLVL